ncbi:ABC transporter permease [Streptococcus mutans]|uniref:ABC transporter permease n=1 Tax=Streptococcus mutans TaxID=1309 RepID=UPI002740A658|nr:ABC transporter permease [Streptococcus mutans]MDP5865713.1 ABC transporter permease [Streptococcus mutans]
MISNVKSLLWLRQKIISSNKSIRIQMLLPFLLTYLYSFNHSGYEAKQFNLMLSVSMVLAMTVGGPMQTLLTEEKEKRTLKELLLSGVRSWEYIVSSLIFPIVIGISAVFLIPLLLNFKVGKMFIPYTVITLMTVIAVVLFYLFLGLIAKMQSISQALAIPSMFIIVLLPMLSRVNSTVAAFTDYSFMGLETRLFLHWDQLTLSTSLIAILSLSLWIIIFLILDTLLFKTLKKNL